MSLAVRRGLYGKLAGDTTLTAFLPAPPANTSYSKNIYYEYAPAQAAFPYVIFAKQSGTPIQAFRQGKSAMDDDVWMVKGTDRNTTPDVADQIADRLNALLTDASLSISGANHLYLRRVSDLDYAEVTDGQTYRHSGALWRLVTEPT